MPCTRPNSQFLTVGLQLSLGADFDMELLLCALTKFSAERKGPDEVLCDVSPTLFTEDFAESNFMASADDEDKPCVT